MITIDEIKKKIAEIEAKSAVAPEMRAFITMVLSFVNKSKEELSNIGKENLQSFKKSVYEIKKEADKLKMDVSYETTSIKGEFEKKVSELETFISRLEAVEAKQGEPGENGKTPTKGEDYFNDDDKKEMCDMVMGMMEEDMTAEEMVAEINKLPLDDDKKIDASHIKGLPENTGGARGRIVRVAHDSSMTGSGTMDDPLSVVASAETFLDLTDTPDTYAGQGGLAVYVKADTTGLEFKTAVSTDEKVKLSALDATAGYLDAKLQEGIQAVQFDLTPTGTTPQAGQIQWNATNGTFDMGMLNNSTLQVGQEMYFYGKASGNIANGEVCEFAGVQGDHILIKTAVASEIEANPHYLIGVATNAITNGNYGYVTWFGNINGIYTKTPANGDTVDWVAGDVLYFNVATGQLTKIAPTAPHRVITVAALIKEQTGSSENGIMVVRPQLVPKLADLSDVDGTPLTTTGQILVWDQTAGYWDASDNITNYLKTVEGTAVKSTGEAGGTKFLREDGDGTSSWQAIPAAGGDVIGPATNTADYIPQWNGADSKTLKNGIPTSTFQPAGTYSTDIHANITALNAVSGTNTGDNATNTTYEPVKNFQIDVNRFGFVNRSQTKISFNGTKTFTITSVGATWSYYRSGLKYTVTGNVTKDLVAGTPVDGTLYYIYIDSTDGSLTCDTGGWTLADTKVPVATVFWNNTLTPKFVMADERHTVGIDRAYHREHHFTEGTVASTYGTISGLVAASDTPANKTFGISGCSIFDEDLKFSPSDLSDPDGATAVYNMLYRTASTTYVYQLFDMPFKYTTAGGPTYGFIEFDSNGTSTPSQANRFVNTYLFVSNAVANDEVNPEINTVSQRYFIMQGRGEYTTAALAYAEKFLVSAGMPVAEGAAIYQFTWATTNRPDTVKGRCRYVSTQQILANNITTSVVVATAHNGLAGLDGGDATNGYYGHLTQAEYTALSGLTASEIVGTNASGDLASLPVASYPSLTELTYVKGVTSSIQTQLNGKQASGSYLTSVGTGVANELVYWATTSTLGSLATATYPSLTEVSYVKGVTSGIQAQLNGKAPTLSGTINEIAYWSSTSAVGSLAVATYPSLVELAYVKGVTSGIQAQINAKGVGDMTLAGVQSVTGAKTFDKDKILVKGTSTGTTNLTTANTSANNYTATFPAKDGTVAMTSDITGGGLTWSAITADQTAVVDNGYLANKGSLLLLTLPATSAVGKTVRVAGMNSGLWKVVQAANQYIKFGNLASAVGVGGYISSTQTYDAVELVCIEADLGWTVVSSIGEITIV